MVDTFTKMTPTNRINGPIRSMRNLIFCSTCYLVFIVQFFIGDPIREVGMNKGAKGKAIIPGRGEIRNVNALKR